MKCLVSAGERRKEGREGKGEEKERDPRLADKSLGLQELQQLVCGHTPN